MKKQKKKRQPTRDEQKKRKAYLLRQAEIFCLRTGYRKGMSEMEKKRWLMRMLYQGYLEGRKGKRRTRDEQMFEEVAFLEIEALAMEIMERRYEPGTGIAFIVHDPVVREIFAAPFRDRVIHHFLFNITAYWWEKRFIYDSYSCREEKGTLFGIYRMQHHMRQATRNGTQRATVVMLDIQGYFMSLDRRKLMAKIRWGLDRQLKKLPWIYQISEYLWEVTIMDDPTSHVELRGDLRAWKKLPKPKSLFCQTEGKGIVIGNLSSQLLSNIFLDELDRYIVQTLGYRHYGRYVDDFWFIAEEGRHDEAMRDVSLIRDKLREMGLRLHPKKVHVQEVKRGASFIGAKIYLDCVLPGKRQKHNAIQAIELFLNTKKENAETVQAYIGMFSKIDAAKWFNQMLMRKFGITIRELQAMVKKKVRRGV